MTPLIVRSTFLSVMTLMILTSPTYASEVIGVLDSSGASQANTSVFTESETDNSVSEPSEAPTSRSSPKEADTPGTVLSSHTDTPNVPVRNSFVEHAPALEDLDGFAVLNDSTAENPQVAASAVAGSTTTTLKWWWLSLSLFVISLGIGSYAYQRRVR